MMRWTATDVAEYDRKQRSAEGFVEVKPKLARRGQHKSAYLYHCAAYCRHEKMPEPVGEHYFHESRDWRFDIAFVEHKIAIEVDGLWLTKAHTNPVDVRRNMEKQNAAVMCGWRVLRCEPAQLGAALLMAKALMQC